MLSSLNETTAGFKLLNLCRVKAAWQQYTHSDALMCIKPHHWQQRMQELPSSFMIQNRRYSPDTTLNDAPIQPHIRMLIRAQWGRGPVPRDEGAE